MVAAETDRAGWKLVRVRESRAVDSKTGHVYVKQHPGDAQLPLDELRDMVGLEGEAFSNRMLAI